MSGIQATHVISKQKNIHIIIFDDIQFRENKNLNICEFQKNSCVFEMQNETKSIVQKEKQGFD